MFPALLAFLITTAAAPSRSDGASPLALRWWGCTPYGESAVIRGEIENTSGRTINSKELYVFGILRAKDGTVVSAEDPAGFWDVPSLERKPFRSGDRVEVEIIPNWPTAKAATCEISIRVPNPAEPFEPLISVPMLRQTCKGCERILGTPIDPFELHFVIASRFVRDGKPSEGERICRAGLKLYLDENGPDELRGVDTSRLCRANELKTGWRSMLSNSACKTPHPGTGAITLADNPLHVYEVVPLDILTRWECVDGLWCQRMTVWVGEFVLSRDVALAPSPSQMGAQSGSADVAVRAGTRVDPTHLYSKDPAAFPYGDYWRVRVVAGPAQGKTGWVKTGDIKGADEQ